MRSIVVLLVTLAAVLGQAPPAAAIAYGENAPDGAYRFSVLLTMTGLPADGGGTRDSSCSGALIAARWVITAGHCFRVGDKRVDRVVAERTTATIGRTSLKTMIGYEVEVIAVHQSGTADVALAELAEPVTGITPIRVGTQPPDVGETLRLTGFGLTTRGGDITPATHLQTGQFVVDAVGDSLVEASGSEPRPDTSPCPHDSGGPYFRELPDRTPVLVAVVSSGPGCPHPGPDFSARTDNLHEWITSTTSERSSGYGTTALLVFLVAVVLAAVLGAALVVLAIRGRRGRWAHRSAGPGR